MILFMERTPKIISLFQKLSPQSTLVGFKLLDNAPHAALIDKGFQVLTQNKCSFVLANDCNIAKLRNHGYQFIDPRESLLACGDLGKGALADINVIVAAVKDAIGE